MATSKKAVKKWIKNNVKRYEIQVNKNKEPEIIFHLDTLKQQKQLNKYIKNLIKQDLINSTKK